MAGDVLEVSTSEVNTDNNVESKKLNPASITIPVVARGIFGNSFLEFNFKAVDSQFISIDDRSCEFKLNNAIDEFLGSNLAQNSFILLTREAMIGKFGFCKRKHLIYQVISLKDHKKSLKEYYLDGIKHIVNLRLIRLNDDDLFLFYSLFANQQNPITYRKYVRSAVDIFGE